MRVGRPDDEYEREADRVAEQVVRMPEETAVQPVRVTHPVPRRSAPSPDSSSTREDGHGDVADTPALQREAAEPPSSTAPPEVHEVLRTPGRPLDPVTRGFMENRFGHDFSRVRVHTDATAERSARAVNARAYTLGRDVVFGAEQYAPQTGAGKRLLAHELTHVVQQNGRHSVLQRQPSGPSKEDEFDFMLVNVEGEQKVAAVLSPTDPGKFMESFRSKGHELIEATHKWLFNNMSRFITDAVVKTGKNPFVNMDSATMRLVGVTAFGNLASSVAKGATTTVGSAIIRVVNIGRKATSVARGLGGLLTFIGSTLISAFISSLFDRTDEIVEKTSKQVRESIGTLVNNVIIPSLTERTTAFNSVIDALVGYIEQGKTEGGQKEFSAGTGKNKISIVVDQSEPMTPEKARKLMLELANRVLAIDATIPKLESDLSLYQELALRAGVFTESVAEARPSDESSSAKQARTVKAIFTEFAVTRHLPEGETKFEVPKNGIVEITSSTHYRPDPTAPAEPVRPPAVYRIALHRASDDERVSVPRQYKVGESETATWYNLKGGTYYVSVERGGNSNFTLHGRLKIIVKATDVPFKD